MLIFWKMFAFHWQCSSVHRNCWLSDSYIQSLSQTFKWPTVCAVSNDQSTNEPATTVDQLEAGRPTVVVTEEDVKAFIASETGQDRLQAMFSKE